MAVGGFVLAGGSHAVQPGQLVDDAEADFSAGDAEGVLVTDHGRVIVGPSVSPLAELPDAAQVVLAVLPLDAGGWLVAAGPEPMLLRVDAGGELTVVARGDGAAIDEPDEGQDAEAADADLVEEQARGADAAADEVPEQADDTPALGGLVLALSQVGGRALAAVSGDDGVRLIVVTDDGGVEELALLEELRYVWEMVAVGDSLYVAGGTPGRVMRLAVADDGTLGEPEVVLEVAQDNVLSLASDGQAWLWAGTDTEGLVYRLRSGVAADQAAPFVLLDAAEPAVTALALRPDGTLLVGTASGEAAGPGRLNEPAEEEAGQPAEPAELAEDEVPAADDAEAEAEAVEGAQVADDAAEGEADEAGAGDEGAEQAADDAGAADEPREVTDEDRDRLRELLQERLLQARRSGRLSAQPMAAAAPGERPSGARARPGRAGANGSGGGTSGPGGGGGTGVYAVDPQGLVRPVWQESASVLAMHLDGDRLTVGTDDQGQVWMLDLASDEASLAAQVESGQVTWIGPAGDVDASLHLGLSNPGGLVAMGSGAAGDGEAEPGVFTSRVLDAEQVSLWGRAAVTVVRGNVADVRWQVRSGNVADPADGGWSTWSDPAPLQRPAGEPAGDLMPVPVEVDAPPARYVQYRLVLSRGGADAQGPAVERVTLAYLTPNMAPRLTSLTAELPDVPEPGEAKGTTVSVSWEASDPNDDALRYRVDYRRAGTEPWINAEEDVESTSYEWQTRTVPDGWHELRVTASDAADNPADMARRAARTSEPVLVDNGRPEVTQAQQADGTWTVQVRDALSPIRSAGYVVNGEEPYTPVLPEDLIFDSTQETLSFTVPSPPDRPQVVTLRITDAAGNTLYHPLTD
jgi:hypothetical protein